MSRVEMHKKYKGYAFIGNAEEKDRYMQEHKDEYGHQLLVANSVCDGE